jgi:formylglycine-generating enzyme required for sulfatase activity
VIAEDNHKENAHTMIRNAVFARTLAAVMALYAFAVLAQPVRAEGKKALVIGNGAYAVGALRNSANDAKDIAEALRAIGFQVTLLADATLGDMRDAVDAFGASLKAGDIGVFYYSGHGIQVDGKNYLIPVDLKVTAASQVKNRSMLADEVLSAMQAARNTANVVILDACRDNPFPADARDLTRGLVAVGNQPPDSIILYSTSANATASDGAGRNGLFTEQLLKNIKAKDSLENVINKTANAVREASGGKQVPAKYSQLFKDVWLAGQPEKIQSGTLILTSGKAASASVNGQPALMLAAGKPLAIPVPAGAWKVVVQADGKSEIYEGTVKDGEQVSASAFAPVAAQPAAPQVVVVQTASGTAATLPPAIDAKQLRASMVKVAGGSFTWYAQPSAVDPFEISAYEITQAQYREVMGANPSYFEGDLRPVESVSFVQAAEFCNRLSKLHGCTPAYEIDGEKVYWTFGAGGYRLPTAAEWHWASTSAGAETKAYPGSNSPSEAGWFIDNGGKESHQVGLKKPNALGLYDMFGNVSEWVWDAWNGTVRNGFEPAKAKLAPGDDRPLDPLGPIAPVFRVNLAMGVSWAMREKDTNSYAMAPALSLESQAAKASPSFGFRVVRGALSSKALAGAPDLKKELAKAESIRAAFVLGEQTLPYDKGYHFVKILGVPSLQKGERHALWLSVSKGGSDIAPRHIYRVAVLEDGSMSARSLPFKEFKYPVIGEAYVTTINEYMPDFCAFSQESDTMLLWYGTDRQYSNNRVAISCPRSPASRRWLPSIMKTGAIRRPASSKAPAAAMSFSITGERKGSRPNTGFSIW